MRTGPRRCNKNLSPHSGIGSYGIGSFIFNYVSIDPDGYYVQGPKKSRDLRRKLRSKTNRLTADHPNIVDIPMFGSKVVQRVCLKPKAFC